MSEQERISQTEDREGSSPEEGTDRKSEAERMIADDSGIQMSSTNENGEEQGEAAEKQ